MFFTDKKIAQLREQLEKLQLAQEQQSYDFGVMSKELEDAQSKMFAQMDTQHEQLAEQLVRLAANVSEMELNMEQSMRELSADFTKKLELINQKIADLTAEQETMRANYAKEAKLCEKIDAAIAQPARSKIAPGLRVVKKRKK